MDITLFDINKNVCEALYGEFYGCKDVAVRRIKLEKLPYHDCLVTAGNSFGAMSGGIDLAVRDMFGYECQDRIQLAIMNNCPYGLPVGEVDIFDIAEGGPFGHIMYAPTMRVPSKARALDVAYVMSVVITVAREMKYKSIAVPGLGTGCGGLSPEIAAKAMRAGYDTEKHVMF